MVCYLNILSSPSRADVWIDGNYQGDTPIYNIYMYPGYYHIRIEKSDYVPWEHLNYYISPQDLVKTLDVTLEPITPETSYVKCKSDPDDAKVYIDDNYEGKTTVTVEKIAGSFHDIDFEKSGYKDKSRNDYEWPSAGETKTCSVTLTTEARTWRNSVQWESYDASGGTWYLHVCYGKKTNGGFSIIASKYNIYLNHPLGIYNPNIDVTLPEGTAGTYDAWTVIADGTDLNTATIFDEIFDYDVVEVG